MKAKDYNRNLPKMLHLTQADLDAQDAINLAQTPPVYDEDAVRYARAVNEEKLALESLQLGGDKIYELTRLAEAYIEQGKFAEAYTTHPDPRTKEFYKKIWKPKSCKCTSVIIVEHREKERRTVDVSKRLWRTVFLDNPAQKASIFVCNTCRGVTIETNETS